MGVCYLNKAFDDMIGVVLRLRFLHSQEMFYHGIGFVLSTAMLFQESLQERISSGADRLQPLLQTVEIKPPKQRQEVSLVVCTQQRHNLRDYVSELLRFLRVRHVTVVTVVPFPRYHSHHVVE